MNKISESDELIIRNAIDNGVSQYIATRKQNIPAFVAQHFSFKGSFAIHRKAMGRDLYRSPLNIAWALPYMLSRFLPGPLELAGYKHIAVKLKNLPKGFETDVQKEIKRLIYTDLLELPYSSEQGLAQHDALLNEILVQPGIQGLLSGHLSQIYHKSLQAGFAAKMESKIRDYTASRTVAEDISGSIILLAVGLAAFRQVSPGPVSTGASVATAITHKAAVSKFWAGSTVGNWYYGAFPVAASRHVFLLSTASVMAILAVITTFSGVITDPIQSKLGMHKKRLQRLIDLLDTELTGKENERHHAKEHYFARVFDILDLLRTAAGA